ncbi:MAG: DUF6538 domain-containing protein [Burkholderiaceae bacterium]
MSRTPRHVVAKGGRFYFRLRVPADLVASIGKSEISQPLGMLNRSQAEAAADDLAREWNAHFVREKHRMGLGSNPTPAPKPAARSKRPASADEVERLGEASARALLVSDETCRAAALDADSTRAWRASLEALDRDVTDLLEHGVVGATRDRLESDLAVHGLTLADDAAESRRMIRTWTAAQARALKAIAARGRGIAVPTPAPVSLPASLQRTHDVDADASAAEADDGSPRLRDVFERWKADQRERPLKTVRKAALAVTRFERLTGNPPLGRLTRAMGLRFRDALMVSEGGRNSAADRLSWVQVLLNFEVAHAARIGVNPWRGLGVKGARDPQSGVREEWTDADACRLFALPLFQRYELPADKNAGADAAYWLPIIAAFTGARITEIAQLLVADVRRDADSWCIRFAATEPWQSLRADAARRTLPMHTELVRLGLPEYAASQQAVGESRLFPVVTVSDLNYAGGGPSKWFSAFKSAAGFGPASTFHGLRNTVSAKLQRAREAQRYIDRYLGHQTVGSAALVDEHLSAADLIGTAAKVTYEGLVLPRVYRASARP